MESLDFSAAGMKKHLIDGGLCLFSVKYPNFAKYHDKNNNNIAFVSDDIFAVADDRPAGGAGTGCRGG